MCKNSQLRRNQSHSYASGTCGDLIRSAILPRFLVHFQTVCFHLRIADNNIRRYRQETAFNHQGLYRDHFFDFPNELQSHRVRRDDITTGLASLRTNPGVRVFFRTNEQTILPEIRGGRQVKGFTLEKNIY